MLWHDADRAGLRRVRRQFPRAFARWGVRESSEARAVRSVSERDVEQFTCQRNFGPFRARVMRLHRSDV